ncbi:PfkB family carbohydrate kinase [Haloactinopolyspora sp.]|uniref:PfkB family carbohydrate kinase n=1 Tax=Haloactinopolyspora sp. TaxID=1966353 RepID=UPI00261CC7C3|nr:PfkB family carbohydrate kinase [Haloactinopolyspora sp.]
MSNVARDPHRAAPPRHDPLAEIRSDDGPDLDVFLTGTVFFDIIFIGLDGAPRRGTEVWAQGMGSSPGGVANLAVAAARLGLHTGLAAAFGEDLYGDYCRQTLGIQEGVDLTHSRYVTGWHSPVTVSMVYERDRAMVTHGHQPEALSRLVTEPPRARSCSVDLAADRQDWVDSIARSGGLVFADLGWDPDDRWDIERLRESLAGCHAFSPNAVEAMSYTRTDTPEAAAEALAELVPLPVVTNGRDGAVAFDRDAGRLVHVPGLPVEAIDPTGAGDVFVAGLMVGTLANWPVEHSLRLANLGAALSVRHFGGALASPGWGDIALWYRDIGSKDPALAADYEFLEAVLPDDAVPEVSRAIATLGFRAGR